jgi:hypothetical protein
MGWESCKSVVEVSGSQSSTSGISDGLETMGGDFFLNISRIIICCGSVLAQKQISMNTYERFVPAYEVLAAFLISARSRASLSLRHWVHNEFPV